MKKIVAIMALVGILFQTFSQVLVVAAYYANKDYIAKNLCENRDKPKMHCDGKCCLKKKLAKQGKEQAPSGRNQKSEEVVNLFYSPIDHSSNNTFISSLPVQYHSYNELHTASYHHSVFHPPAA